MILHSENGTGKTLTYLLPIFNDLYKTHNADARFTMNKDNEDLMF